MKSLILFPIVLLILSCNNPKKAHDEGVVADYMVSDSGLQYKILKKGFGKKQSLVMKF